MNAIALFEARDGKLWTGTQEGSGYWVPKNPKESFLDESSLVPVLSLCEDAQGVMWKGTNEHGIAHWAGGKWISLDDVSLQKRNVFALTIDPEGKIWAGTDAGLRCYDKNGKAIPLTEVPAEVRALLIDSHGVLWVGTSGMGLGRYENGKFTFLTKTDGLGSENITSLYEDTEGSLWVGTRDGLSQLTDLKFPIYTAKEGLCEGSAHSVSPARDGGLWVCSQGLTHITGKNVRAYREELNPINHYLITSYEAQNGELYLADGDKNLAWFSGDKITATCSAEAWPRGLVEDADGLVTGVGPVLSRVKAGKIYPYPFSNNKPPILFWINNISQAKDHSFLLSSSNGVCRVKGGEFTSWTTAEGLSSDKVNWVSEDPEGVLWVGLLTGIARIKNGIVTNIRQPQGLFDERIYAIVLDDLDYFWISSGQGIFRVLRKNLNDLADEKITHIECDVFNDLGSVKFSDRTDQEPSGCKTADGRIWFPNPQGVVMIDPAHYFLNKVPPPVYIHLLRIDGIEIKDPRSALAKPGVRQMEFSFTALSYISPKKVRVRYQLEGIDAGWVEAGPRRSAQYTNLKPGHYNFRVEACNADGVWNNKAAAYHFELRPAFYETIPFVVCCILATAFAIYGGFRWKVRHIQARQKKLQADNDLLETKVAERTAELEREHALLRALLDYSPDQVYFKDCQSRFLKASKAQAVTFGVKSADELVGKTDFDYFTEEHARPAYNDEQEIIRTGIPIIGKIEKQVWVNGTVSWVITSKMALRNGANQIVGTFGTSKDISPIKEAEAKLDQIHKELLDSSRRAGMAEVATNVLHNVGNVLNSVNVSSGLVAEYVRNSRVHSLGKISTLLMEHQTDIGQFVTADPRGKHLPAYIKNLWEAIAAEQRTILKETESLCKNIEHIKDIVSTQQSYAKVSGMTETLPLVELLEDALRMNSGTLERHTVSLERDYQIRPNATIDKHKVIQILVNLIKNASAACVESGRVDKMITLRVTGEGERILISVTDNGVGIPAENLTRIFSHGFTTRKDGHGFGLHSGALAAKEIGGALRVHSAGSGKGATFTLELPRSPIPGAAQSRGLLQPAGA